MSFRQHFAALFALVLAGCSPIPGPGDATDVVPPETVYGRGEIGPVAECIMDRLKAAKRNGIECEKPYERWVFFRSAREWSFVCDMSAYYGAGNPPPDALISDTRPASEIQGLDRNGLAAIFAMRLRALDGGRLESYQWVHWHLTAVASRQRVLREAFAACAAPD